MIMSKISRMQLENRMEHHGTLQKALKSTKKNIAFLNWIWRFYLVNLFQILSCTGECIILKFWKIEWRNKCGCHFSEHNSWICACVATRISNYASSAAEKRVCRNEDSSTGNEPWGISKLPLAITYGRYHNPLAKAFKREFEKQGQDFTYLYKCKSIAFQKNINSRRWPKILQKR